MAVQTLQLQLPDAIYQRLQRVAEATNQPLEKVVLQTIRGNLLAEMLQVLHTTTPRRGNDGAL